MALLSIPIWLLIIRGMDEKRWIWKIAAHTLIAPFYAVAIYELYYILVDFLTEGAGTKSLAISSQWIILYNFLLYIAQFSIYHAVQTFKKLRYKERQSLALIALAKEQELSALKSQINPHFLFNTLNSISAMISRDPEETRLMIAQLGDLLRYAIDMSKKDFVTLKDELEFTKSYLALESKRLSDRLQIEYNVQPETLSIFIPPMVLQPLVENAIKHGIEPSEKGGMVSLNIAIEQDQLSVVIKDTGVGFQKNSYHISTNKVGLQNTDSRLKTLYGEQYGLLTKTLESEGFEVGFRIPLHRRNS